MGKAAHEVVSTQGGPCGDTDMTAICRLRREAAGGTNPAGTLTLALQPPELSESKFLLLRYCVPAAEAGSRPPRGGRRREPSSRSSTGKMR